MRKHIVCKASPVGDQIVDPVAIEISGDLDNTVGPAGEQPSEVVAQIMLEDAARLRLALRHLPMGTRDQLLIMMLEDAATVLRIPGKDLDDKE
jgi:hypothetical protein